MRSAEEATKGLSLNGQISIEGKLLKVGRPKKNGVHTHRTNNPTVTVQPMVDTSQQDQLGKLIMANLTSARMMVIMNLPSNFGDTEVNAICAQFGKVEALQMNVWGQGTATVTFETREVCELVYKRLNGFNAAGKYLSVI